MGEERTMRPERERGRRSFALAGFDACSTSIAICYPEEMGARNWQAAFCPEINQLSDLSDSLLSIKKRSDFGEHATPRARKHEQSQHSQQAIVQSQQLQQSEQPQPSEASAPIDPSSVKGSHEHQTSRQVAALAERRWPRPDWRPPWYNYRVLASHLGWVRGVAVDPANQLFATGSADRTIKLWDLATGSLKLTLTGHMEQVTALAFSPNYPYMFSVGLDKQVMCWDLEANRVIRHYHGHLSGIYSLSLHPRLDVLCTGARDSTCRVWDMRTRTQVHCLSGHTQTVRAIETQPTDPQVITGSEDSTVKLWDLTAGKTMSTLTYHKKGVRALAVHPTEHTFVAASSESIKKFELPEGTLLHDMLENQNCIVNSMALNDDNVLATGGDNGSLWLWDYQSGHNFQQLYCKPQPGSLEESEAGVYGCTFDRSGTRLITTEVDKSVKMWKEVEGATPGTHPNREFKPPNSKRWRRY